MITTTSTVTTASPAAGSNVAVTFPYRFDEEEHLDVYRVTTAGVRTKLTEGVDYSVSGTRNSGGGTLTLGTVSEGDTIIVDREVDITQQQDYVENAKFPAVAHEDQLDKLVMIDQQLNSALGRSIKVLPGEPNPVVGTRKNRQDRFVAYDGNGDYTEYTAGEVWTKLPVPPGTAVPGLGTATWADNPARAAKVPDFEGQLGVQLNTGQVYRSTGVLAGNWTVAFGETAAADVTQLKALLAASAESILIVGTITLDSNLEIPRQTTLKFVRGVGIIDPNGFILHYMSSPGAEFDQQIFTSPKGSGTHTPGRIKGFFGGEGVHIGWWGGHGMALKCKGTGSANLHVSTYQGTLVGGNVTYINHGLNTGDVIYQYSDQDDATRQRGTAYTVTVTDADHFSVDGGWSTYTGNQLYIFKDATWELQAAIYAVDDSNSGPGSYHAQVRIPAGNFFTSQPIALGVDQAYASGATGQAPQIIGQGVEYTRFVFIVDAWAENTAAITIGAVSSGLQFAAILSAFATSMSGALDKNIDTVSIPIGIGEGTKLERLRIIHTSRGRAFRFARPDGNGNAVPYQVEFNHHHNSITAATGDAIGIDAPGGYTLSMRNMTLNHGVAITHKGMGSTVVFDGTATATWGGGKAHGLVKGQLIQFGLEEFGTVASNSATTFAAMGLATGTVTGWSAVYRVTEGTETHATNFKFELESAPGTNISASAPAAGTIRVQGMLTLMPTSIDLKSSPNQQNRLEMLNLIAAKTGVKIADGGLSASDIVGYAVEILFHLATATNETTAINLSDVRSVHSGSGAWQELICVIWDEVLGVRRGIPGSYLNYSRSANRFAGGTPSHAHFTIGDDPLSIPLTGSKPVAVYNGDESITLWRNPSGPTATTRYNMDQCDIWKNALPRKGERQVGHDLVPAGTAPAFVNVLIPPTGGTVSYGWITYTTPDRYHVGLAPWSAIPKDGFTVMIVMRSSSQTADDSPVFTLGYADSGNARVQVNRVDTVAPVGALANSNISLRLLAVDGSGNTLNTPGINAGDLDYGIVSLRFGPTRQEVRWNGNLCCENKIPENWYTGTAYAVGDWIISPANGIWYKCSNAHTSGTFATDFTNGEWGLWVTATAYVVGDYVVAPSAPGTNQHYRCITAHTSGTWATDTANWEAAAERRDLSRFDYADEEACTLGQGANGTTPFDEIGGTSLTYAVGDYVSLYPTQNWNAFTSGFVTGQEYRVVSVSPLKIAEINDATNTPKQLSTFDIGVFRDSTPGPSVFETYTIRRSPKIYLGGAPGKQGYVQMRSCYILDGYIPDTDLNIWGRWITSAYNEIGFGGKVNREWGWSDVRY